MAVMADSSQDPADIPSIGDAVDEEYTKNSKPPYHREIYQAVHATDKYLVVSVVLFGDPTHQSDAPYNHGTGIDSGVCFPSPLVPAHSQLSY